MSRRSFARWLGAVALLALAVRLVYVLGFRRDFVPGGDAFFYHGTARLLADGEGFVSPFFFPGRRVPAAEHPPLYSVFLALPSLLGMSSVLAHQLWSVAAGVATVVVTGVLGRVVAGSAVGLAAAALVAVGPNAWAPDGMLQAETLAMLLATVAVLLAYHARSRPGPARLAAVGATCGLAALARSELLLLAPLLVLPLAFAMGDASVRRRIGTTAAGLAAALGVVMPWVGYNATRFEHPVLMSAQIGPLLSAANCDTAWSGPLRGYFDITCTMAADRAAGITAEDDQSVMDRSNRRAAGRYVRENIGGLPGVVAVRLVRIVDLYHPSKQAVIDSYVEGRERPVAWAGIVATWITVPLAAAGAVVLRRRRIVVGPLLAPVVAVVLTVVVTYASTRFRAAAEPSLAVLAAAALVAAARALLGRSGRSAVAE